MFPGDPVQRRSYKQKKILMLIPWEGRIILFVTCRFAELPQEKQASWEEYVSGKLAALLKQNTVDLVSTATYRLLASY